MTGAIFSYKTRTGYMYVYIHIHIKVGRIDYEEHNFDTILTCSTY